MSLRNLFPASNKQSGQAMAEYALIIALVILIGIVLLPKLGAKINDTFDKTEKAFDQK